MGGGEASTALEPQSNQEDDIPEPSEPIPPKPFTFEFDLVIIQEDVAVPEPFPRPEPEPSAPVPDLPLSQDSQLGTPTLDLNEHATDSAQDC